MKLSISLFTAFLIFAAASYAAAQQKVVVIPLMDDAKNLKNVVTVSPSHGDYTNPAAAVDSITDASETNPYLVVIGPGVYTMSETLVMKPYVSITGSGITATILRGSISGTSQNTSAIISSADNCTLSFLTLENNGGDSTFAIGIYNSDSPVIHDVSISVSGENSDNNFAIYNNYSSPVLYDVTAYCTGGSGSTAIYNYHSSPVLSEVTAHASGASGISTGMTNTYMSSTPEVNNCKFTGVTGSGTYSYGVYNSSSASLTIRNSYIEGGYKGVGIYTGTVRILQSSVVGGGLNNSGTLTCTTSDNGVSAVVSSTCN